MILRILGLNQDMDVQQECIWALSELSKSGKSCVCHEDVHT